MSTAVDQDMPCYERNFSLVGEMSFENNCKVESDISQAMIR